MTAMDSGSTLTGNSQTINIFLFGKRRRADFHAGHPPIPQWTLL